MYTPTQQLAILVRDVLQQPEQTVVVLGRDNVDIKNVSDLQIAVDALSDAVPVSFNRHYDGVNEVANYGAKYRQLMTINFYGDEAYEQGKKFAALVNAQVAYEIQRDLGFSVMQVGALRDLKLLTGEQFSARYELELFVEFTENVGVETKRIDTLQLTTVRG